jgi:hypothetical protein
MKPTSNTDFESASHSALADTPQSSTVLRVFLVDAILLVLLLCWRIGIRSGILDFSMPLRVLLVVLWGGALWVAFRYGMLPFRGHSMPIKLTFSARLVGLSIGILIIIQIFFEILFTFFGTAIQSHGEGVIFGMIIWTAISRFGLPRWQDKFSVALAGALYLMYALSGIGVALIFATFGTLVQLYPTRADHLMYALFGIAVVLILLGVIGLVAFPLYPLWKQAARESVIKK